MINQFNHTDFIERDLIQITIRFSRKEGIEIAGFFGCNHSPGTTKKH